MSALSASTTAAAMRARAAGRKSSAGLTQGVLFPSSSPVLEQIRDELRAILGILK